MKKILMLILASIMIFSCDIIPSRVVLNNTTLNREASKFLDINKNLLVAKISITNYNTRVIDGYVYSDLKYRYSALGGLLAENEGMVRTKTLLKVEKNKLYLKDPQVLDITAANGLKENEKIANTITKLILDTMSLGSLYDFKNDYYVRDVIITKNNVILEIE